MYYTKSYSRWLAGGRFNLPPVVIDEVLELSAKHRVDLNSFDEKSNGLYLFGEPRTQLVITASRNGAQFSSLHNESMLASGKNQLEAVYTPDDDMIISVHTRAAAAVEAVTDLYRMNIEEQNTKTYRWLWKSIWVPYGINLDLLAGTSTREWVLDSP